MISGPPLGSLLPHPLPSSTCLLLPPLPLSLPPLQAERGENLFSFARQVAIRSSQAILQVSPDAAAATQQLGPVKRSLLWAARFVPMPLFGLLLIDGTCAPPEAAMVRSPEVQALLQLDVPRALKLVLARQLTAE